MDEDELFKVAEGLAAHNQRNQTNRELAALRQQRQGVAACPHCGGGLPKFGVDLCMHCRSKLVWYKTVAGKPGQEKLCREIYEKVTSEAKKTSTKNQSIMYFVFSMLSLAYFVWCTYDATVAYPAKLEIAAEHEKIFGDSPPRRKTEQQRAEWREVISNNKWSTETPPSVESIKSDIRSQILWAIGAFISSVWFLFLFWRNYPEE